MHRIIDTEIGTHLPELGTKNKTRTHLVNMIEIINTTKMELQLISLNLYLHGGSFEKYTYQTLFCKQNHKVKINYDALAMHSTCTSPNKYNTYNIIYSLHERR